MLGILVWIALSRANAVYRPTIVTNTSYDRIRYNGSQKTTVRVAALSTTVGFTNLDQYVEGAPDHGDQAANDQRVSDKLLILF